MTISLFASQAGWQIFQPSDVMMDGSELAKKSSRYIIGQQIERDNPFVLAVAFPCGPWNPWTVSNVSKGDIIAQRMDFRRSEHLPMLRLQVMPDCGPWRASLRFSKIAGASQL